LPLNGAVSSAGIQAIVFVLLMTLVSLTVWATPPTVICTGFPTTRPDTDATIPVVVVAPLLNVVATAPGRVWPTLTRDAVP
jgi:hypothetical protein